MLAAPTSILTRQSPSILVILPTAARPTTRTRRSYIAARVSCLCADKAGKPSKVSRDFFPTASQRRRCLSLTSTSPRSGSTQVQRQVFVFFGLQFSSFVANNETFRRHQQNHDTVALILPPSPFSGCVFISDFLAEKSMFSVVLRRKNHENHFGKF